MSGGELLVTLIIAVCVFKPSRMPVLAELLGAGLRHLRVARQRLAGFTEKLEREALLGDSEKRAQSADAEYRRRE